MKKDNKSIILYLIGILMLFVGLAVTTASTILIISHNIKSKKYIETTAIVVKYDKKDNGLRAIVVEYNIDNKYYQVTSKHYSRKPDKLDTEIKIKYNPENHGEIIWIDNNRNGKYLASGLILLVGDIVIWVIINLNGKKKKGEPNKEEDSTNLPEDIKTEEIKEDEETKKEEPKPEDGTILLPIIEEKEEPAPVVEEKTEEEPNVEKDKKEEPEQEPVLVKEATKEIPVIKEEQKEEEEPKVEEPKEEEPKVEEKEDKEEKLPVPELPEDEVEIPKLNIPEIPYDMDSPREAVVSNVIETTVALPILKKEQIELPTKKEEKSLKVDKEMQQDALSKLLEDMEKKD